MVKFVIAMVIPLGVLIYTVSFGNWLHRRRVPLGPTSAYLLAILSFAACGVVLWKMIT